MCYTDKVLVYINFEECSYGKNLFFAALVFCGIVNGMEATIDVQCVKFPCLRFSKGIFVVDHPKDVLEKVTTICDRDDKDTEIERVKTECLRLIEIPNSENIFESIVDSYNWLIDDFEYGWFSCQIPGKKKDVISFLEDNVTVIRQSSSSSETGSARTDSD